PIESSNNSSEPNINNNKHVTVNKETLQALISLIDNNKTSEERRNQQIFDTKTTSNPNIVPEQGSMEGPDDIVMKEVEFQEPPIEEVNVTKDEPNRAELKEVVVENLVPKENKKNVLKQIEPHSNSSEEFEEEDLEDHIYGISNFEGLSGPRYYRESEVTADYIELVLSWDEEEEYWNQDIRDFLNKKNLIFFTDIHDESKMNKGSFLPEKTPWYNRSPAGILIGKADFPSMHDLFDFYYDNTTISCEYHIGPISQNVKDQLEDMLQNRQDNFVWDSKDLDHTIVVKHKIYTGNAPAIKQ
ncbi:34610_t:CDS:2, partial [Gigaspora margarita]